MFITTRFFYPHGIEGEAMDNTSKEFNDLDKAINHANRYAAGLRFAGVQVEDEKRNIIYEITSDMEAIDYREQKVLIEEPTPSIEVVEAHTEKVIEQEEGTKMKKTLYFEGAGCVPRGEVENCRIRTAFTNNIGERIYLEISGMETNKQNQKHYPGIQYIGFIDSCHYITDEGNDENKNSIFHRNSKTLGYTKSEILSFVNSLDCSFDQVVILPDLAGYRVFKDGEGHNFGDKFQYNEALTNRAEEIRKHFYALEKSEGKQYPNLSLWVDQENPELLHLLRHFNGYNKHWSIQNVDNWKETIRETTLGRYAC